MQMNEMQMTCPMMMGHGSGWVMIGMGVLWLLIVVTLLLAAAALVKYLRSGRNG